MRGVRISSPGHLGSFSRANKTSYEIPFQRLRAGEFELGLRANHPFPLASMLAFKVSISERKDCLPSVSFVANPSESQVRVKVKKGLVLGQASRQYSVRYIDNIEHMYS